ncbi:hypothetical protein SPRG_03792 [Saprolegnia parasitica CBS 223.65]|uniref:Uncharacterized protein n=1 Tax=Saprolegnia parasitica (strain CBS 223.65) TaxID=695850 RepID=A0A067CYJ1_SAPPC|nr:hypothetical protein SPRG_03792 [Saprolegnia parasitica CBS 223.65]KDO31872.1 hypothetical protein SPRG_03792 [Saprolegnia parasitica CBS 223.65]|eukprot:XP_012197750.1 hypothetical protein SPRG_03792 [Saprolegnia parasitica CBS 223.65]
MAANDVGDEFRWLRHVCAAPMLPLAYHLRWRSELTAEYTSPAIYGVAGGLSLLSTVALHAVLLTLLQRWVYDDLEIQLRQAATAKMGRRDWKAASEDWSRILRINPSDADGLKQRGQCFLHLGEADKATSDFARSLALNPADSILQEQLNILRPNQVPSSPPQLGVWSKVIAPFALLSVGSQSTWSTRVLVLLLLPILLACLLLHALVRGAVNVLLSSLHLAWRSARALRRPSMPRWQEHERSQLASAHASITFVFAEMIPYAVTYLRVSCLAWLLSAMLFAERVAGRCYDGVWRCLRVICRLRLRRLGQIVLTVAEAAYPLVDAGVDNVLEGLVAIKRCIEAAIAYVQELAVAAWYWTTTTVLCLVNTLVNRAQVTLAWLGNVSYHLCMHIVLPRLHSFAVATCTVVERSFAWLQQVLRQLYTLCCVLARKFVSAILRAYYFVLYQVVDITSAALLTMVYKLHALLVLTRDIVLRPLARAMRIAACYVGRTLRHALSATAKYVQRQLYNTWRILLRAVVAPILRGYYCLLYQAIDSAAVVLLASATKLRALFLFTRDVLLRPLGRAMQHALRYVGRAMLRVLTIFARRLQRLLKAISTGLGRVWRYLVPVVLRNLDNFVATGLRIAARCVRAFWRLWRGLHYLVVGLLDIVFQLLIACKNVCTSPPMRALYASVAAFLATVYASFSACLAAAYAAMWSAGVWASTVAVATWQAVMAIVQSVVHVASVIVQQLSHVVFAIVSAATQVAYDVANEVQRMVSLGSKSL